MAVTIINGGMKVTVKFTGRQATIRGRVTFGNLDVPNTPVVANDVEALLPVSPQFIVNTVPDAAHGTLEYQAEIGSWTPVITGTSFDEDTVFRFTPNSSHIDDNSRDIYVGTFGTDPGLPTFSATASLSDWGTVNGAVATYVSGDTTITTTVSSGVLTVINTPGGTEGVGIGNNLSNGGLSSPEELRIDIDGETINKVTFGLDGLGDYFDEGNFYETEIQITAYDSDDNVIASQGGYRQSGLFYDTYTLATTSQDTIAYIIIGSTGIGAYVVQNLIATRALVSSFQTTTVQGDFTETQNFINLFLSNINSSDNQNLTSDVAVADDGITSRQLTATAGVPEIILFSDLIENDVGVLLQLQSVGSLPNTNGTLSINGDDNIVYTANVGYTGIAQFEYTITGNQGSTDTATVSVNVI